MNYHISLDLDLKRNHYKGRYISLEGIDGSGKTTQAQALKTHFEKLGRTVTLTSEPKVDLPGGEQIMQFFRGEVRIPGQAFQYWMSANRVINQATIVLPALQKGDIVISDRCFWSAIPYGLMDNGVDFKISSSFPREVPYRMVRGRRESIRQQAELMLLTQSLLSQYYQFVVPDIVFYIDISPEIGLQRSLAKKERKAENDVYEKKDKLEKVVSGYRWLVKEFKEEFTVIAGEREKEDVTNDILTYL